MKRKFILLPITLTALAPAISLVGCNDPKSEPPPTPVDPVELEFTENIGKPHYTPGFIIDSFAVEKDKLYWFCVDLNKMSNESYERLKQAIIGFAAYKTSTTTLRPNFDQVIVELNNERVLKKGSEWTEGEADAIQIYAPEKPWSKTDKFYFRISWPQQFNAKIVCILAD